MLHGFRRLDDWAREGLDIYHRDFRPTVATRSCAASDKCSAVSNAGPKGDGYASLDQPTLNFSQMAKSDGVEATAGHTIARHWKHGDRGPD